MELNDNSGKEIWGEGELDEFQNLIDRPINPEAKEDDRESPGKIPVMLCLILLCGHETWPRHPALFYKA
jgi:hypothetical protein